MLASAIITTYKKPANIVERVLRSVLAQTYDRIAAKSAVCHAGGAV